MAVRTSPTFIPPQFSSEDLPLWAAYKDELESKYDKIEYSVRLHGQKLPPGEDPTYAAMWEKITARRVDTVGHTADRIDIIEFRPFAGPSAIGQLQMYRTLYEMEIAPTKPIKLILITDLITDHILLTAKAAGIEVIIISRK